ncbi:hypothetical protein Hypma_005558 [Hypsizygus marmoreus]|uniref:Uncharacterized protein n=1 Tax=Hypsizygus marmoreus TaxID=39966 RepID=A0A369K208_HYPMA|nr:hypothetical protein Hypma_005558 [Hypsizygus marmoreus]
MARASKEPSTSASRRAASSVSSTATNQSTRATRPTIAKRPTTTERPTKRSTKAKSASSANTSAPTTQIAAAKQRELQELAETVCKYTDLYQTMAQSMCGEPEKMRIAYEKQYQTALANGAPDLRTDEQTQGLLEELATACEGKRDTFDDRVRICLASLAYAQVFLDNVVGHPSRPLKDHLAVLRLITKINGEAYGLPAPSPDLPRLVKLIPDIPITRPVSVEDVEQWRAHPRELLRKAFISHEAIRRVFLISDYCVKDIAGHCYELLYEDSGPDVYTFSLEDVLRIVAGAEFVTNMPMDT